MKGGAFHYGAGSPIGRSSLTGNAGSGHGAAVSRAANGGACAPWAGLALPLRLAFDVGGSVTPFVGAELGYVALPVRGTLDDGSVLVAQRGVWLSGSVGIALEL